MKKRAKPRENWISPKDVRALIQDIREFNAGADSELDDYLCELKSQY